MKRIITHWQKIQFRNSKFTTHGAVSTQMARPFTCSQIHETFYSQTDAVIIPLVDEIWKGFCLRISFYTFGRISSVSIPSVNVGHRRSMLHSVRHCRTFWIPNLCSKYFLKPARQKRSHLRTWPPLYLFAYLFSIKNSLPRPKVCEIKNNQHWYFSGDIYISHKQANTKKSWNMTIIYWRRIPVYLSLCV